jgi:hypothetical protein
MQSKLRLLLPILFLCSSVFSQVNSLEIDPQKEKLVTPYLTYRHQGVEGLAEFKKKQPHAYMLELWYFAESYYIKRNHFAQGDELPFGLVDISRFENQRKENEEAIVVLPGYKDVLVLLPNNKLIFKPE